MLKVVYVGDWIPTSYAKSIFLVGPTPRSSDVPSWRPDFIAELKAIGYDGVVFVPESRNGTCGDYLHQVEWERDHLHLADVIVAWVPRDMATMPALTTNVEFGQWLASGKIVYGRPEEAPNCRYLDWLYRDGKHGEPHSDMKSLAKAVHERLGRGSWRMDGERHVPLHIWNTKQFQSWYTQLTQAGNRLDAAKLLWQYKINGTFLFCYTLWVKVWIEDEKRFKENEFVFSRTDISTILPIYVNKQDVLESKVVLIKEYRSPSRTKDGFIHELPGGSSFKENESVFEVASHELKEETGLDLSAARFQILNARQIAGTLSTHKAHAFLVNITKEEVSLAMSLEAKQTSFGIAEDTERTYIQVRTLNQLLSSDEVDWSMIGMILEGLSKHLCQLA